MPSTPSPDETIYVDVSDAEDGSRLDRVLASHLRDQGLSREKLKQLCRDGLVRIDGAVVTVPKTIVLSGNRIAVGIPATLSTLQAEEGELAVLYRDAFLSVLNKAPGLTVHPAPGITDSTLVHRLLAHFPEISAMEGFRPGIVHRLDKDTSGLILIALTEPVRLALAEEFAQHKVFKEYLALVLGVPAQESGVIEAPIARHPSVKTKMAVVGGGKAAKSAWRTLYADPAGRFALVAVRIFTGRTHQVRVHMTHIGHPLWGDVTYGGSRVRLADGLPRRQMLHAWKLAFRHPFAETHEGLPDSSMVSCVPKSTSDMSHGVLLQCVCPPPPDFSEAVAILSRRMLRVVITGSPGCGKSALLNLLQQRNIPVFSADAEVARLYQPGNDGHRLLRAHFGDAFVPDDSAPVDKAALAIAMRTDSGIRRTVGDLLHPLVRHATQLFWEKQERAGECFAVAEIPLYLESQFHTTLPQISAPLLVGVACPFAIRQQRLREKRHWPDDLIADVESWQWPEDKKIQACDIVVDNSGDYDALIHNTEGLIQQVAEHARLQEEQSRQSVQAAWNENTCFPELTAL